jgi:hypothetical protein
MQEAGSKMGGDGQPKKQPKIGMHLVKAPEEFEIGRTTGSK